MQRQPRIVSQAYTDAAKDQPCIRCGRKDGTVVAAHYCGLYAHRLGKGGARKVHDLFVADLCGRCHAWFDQYLDGNTEGRALEFLLLIAQTQIRRHTQGKLKL